MRTAALLSSALLLLSNGALASDATADPAQPSAASVEAPPPPVSRPQVDDDDAHAQPSAAAIVPPVLLEPPRLEHPLPPEEARALGPATVVVLVTVGIDGTPSDPSVVEDASHPDARLREAALRAASEARFQPATRGGEPLAVRLPFELTFEPPPLPEPPLVDGVALDVASALDESAAVRPFDPTALGQSLAVAGALVLGASVLFTTFSGVTSLDNATREEELAKTPAELANAEKTRAFGTMMLIPFAGPFLALPSAPDASTSLFSALGGAAHVAGAALLIAGGALVSAPLWWPAPQPADAHE